MIRRGPFVILMLAASAVDAQVPVSQPQPAAAAEAPLRVVLIGTHTSGIDPAVARFVDRALQGAAAAHGYQPVDPEHVRSAQQQLAPGVPLGLADLWQLVHRLDSELAVSALVSASGGLYALHLRVASRDGRGPFVARGEASHLDLEATAERLLAQALADRAASAPPPPPSTPPSTVRAPAEQPAPSPSTDTQLQTPPAPAPSRTQLRLALHNDLAFGLADDPFVNEVLGARVDLRLDDALWFGLHVGYANLPGRAGRVHGVLPYAQLEQRIALGPGRALAIPLRLGLGYLLRNGGFLRLSSGLAIPLGARSELVLDVLAPSFWTTRDKTLFSVAAGAEINVEL